MAPSFPLVVITPMLQDYGKARRLPREHRRKVEMTLAVHWMATRLLPEAALLQDINPTVRTDLQMHNHRALVQQAPLFRLIRLIARVAVPFFLLDFFLLVIFFHLVIFFLLDTHVYSCDSAPWLFVSLPYFASSSIIATCCVSHSAAATREVVTRLLPAWYAPGDMVFTEGSIAAEMFFVRAGTICLRSGSPAPEKNASGEVGAEAVQRGRLQRLTDRLARPVVDAGGVGGGAQPQQVLLGEGAHFGEGALLQVRGEHTSHIRVKNV